MKKLATKTLLVIAITLIASSSFAQGALDKQDFDIKIFERKRVGNAEKSKGTISFKEGKVSSSFSVENEFPDAEYKTTSKAGLMGDIVTFTGKSKGKKDILEWDGIVNGDEIEGSLTRTRKGTIRGIYDFKGTLK